MQAWTLTTFPTTKTKDGVCERDTRSCRGCLPLVRAVRKAEWEPVKAKADHVAGHFTNRCAKGRRTASTTPDPSTPGPPVTCTKRPSPGHCRTGPNGPGGPHDPAQPRCRCSSHLGAGTVTWSRPASRGDPVPELHENLSTAFDEDFWGHLGRAVDRRDRFLALLTIYDLHTAPLEQIGARVRFQHHPAVAALQATEEAGWLAELEAEWLRRGLHSECSTPEQVQTQMRVLAARDRVHPTYRWVAQEASWDDLVGFLTLEGGPDGGFDDLVAACQVGLAGSAKLELGKNYWDEMGCGDPDRVHTVMHDQMAAAIGIREVPRDRLPVEALERQAMGGLLATNRRLQPEMVGALGLLELQAGPRCRLVLRAFDRLGAPREAYPFYLEHAEIDPAHGKDWVDKVIVPLVTEQPEWGPRIIRGALWRSVVNARFFAAVPGHLAIPWAA